MKNDKVKIINVYFDGDACDDLPTLEAQVSIATSDSIMDRLEEAKPDTMFRLTLDTLINLNKVKAIKVENAPEEELEYEDDEE